MLEEYDGSIILNTSPAVNDMLNNSSQKISPIQIIQRSNEENINSPENKVQSLNEDTNLTKLKSSDKNVNPKRQLRERNNLRSSEKNTNILVNASNQKQKESASKRQDISSSKERVLMNKKTNSGIYCEVSNEKESLDEFYDNQRIYEKDQDMQAKNQQIEVTQFSYEKCFEITKISPFTNENGSQICNKDENTSDGLLNQKKGELCIFELLEQEKKKDMFEEQNDCDNDQETKSLMKEIENKSSTYCRREEENQLEECQISQEKESTEEINLKEELGRKERNKQKNSHKLKNFQKEESEQFGQQNIEESYDEPTTKFRDDFEKYLEQRRQRKLSWEVFAEELPIITGNSQNFSEQTKLQTSKEWIASESEQQENGSDNNEDESKSEEQEIQQIRRSTRSRRQPENIHQSYNLLLKKKEEFPKKINKQPINNNEVPSSLRRSTRRDNLNQIPVQIPLAKEKEQSKLKQNLGIKSVPPKKKKIFKESSGSDETEEVNMKESEEQEQEDYNDQEEVEVIRTQKKRRNNENNDYQYQVKNRKRLRANPPERERSPSTIDEYQCQVEQIQIDQDNSHGEEQSNQMNEVESESDLFDFMDDSFLESKYLRENEEIDGINQIIQGIQKYDDTNNDQIFTRSTYNQFRSNGCEEEEDEEDACDLPELDCIEELQRDEHILNNMVDEMDRLKNKLDFLKENSKLREYTILDDDNYQNCKNQELLRLDQRKKYLQSLITNKEKNFQDLYRIDLLGLNTNLNKKSSPILLKQLIDNTNIEIQPHRLVKYNLNMFPQIQNIIPLTFYPPPIASTAKLIGFSKNIQIQSHNPFIRIDFQRFFS